MESEIIFVNDGSPDDAQQVLERLTAHNPPIEVIAQSRSGASLRERFAFLVQLAEASSSVAHPLRVHSSFAEAQLERPSSRSAAARARHSTATSRLRCFTCDR